MKSLLTPSESLAFQSFLSSLDASAPEWSLYSSGRPDDIVLDVPVPQAQGREALARATKELMSLDADRWPPRHDSSRRQRQSYDYQRQPHQIGDHQQQHASMSHDPFPFLNAHAHKPPRLLHQDRLHMPDSSQSLTNTTAHLHCSSLHTNGGLNSASSSTSTTPSTTTTTPVYAFSPNGKRSPSALNDAPTHRPVSPRPKREHVPPPQKQTLLSPSQKKANHIQSEQKRRANIRRGYDALCDTVPALREAIREEDEREAEARAIAGVGKNGSVGKSKRGKKKDGDNTDRADGRAGPRSENVVLSKTIEYINELLSEHQALLNRLRSARTALPVGHPVLIPPLEQPLWEREWKGGEGKYDVKMAEGEEEEEEEESS